MGPRLRCSREQPQNDHKFIPCSSRDLLIPAVGAVQRRNCTLCGGNVLSHVAAAPAGCTEFHAPGRASGVVPGIDKTIPVHEIEQVSAEMHHVCIAKEVSAADFHPYLQILGEHRQGDRLGGRPAHLQTDPGDIGVCRYLADKAQVDQLQRG